ncbi:trypsin-like peptidase domain-containing protein [Burkholderia stagnalis]|uniref:trypsin-like peptidase domain-containing protein n=1 Tax=Burkholderia stagnalis TaxID=1503054 RepID=UPI00075FE32E|nr:trypsin-like peptidase domain-containing protein [Burkholderia stagnalis]KWI98596.1 peptidase S1 [Burkholderia stagnalis]KWO31767.1 peptidase S1 [Burkholderia stagnalis]
MVRLTLVRAVLRAALIGGVCAGCPCLQPTAIAASSAPPVAKEKRAAPVDFPAIVERYGAAVVNISVAPPEAQGPAPAGTSFAALDPDDPLAAFFRRGAPQPPTPETAPRAMSGGGSGFIVSADGMILTSAHVVDQATDLTVRLTDRREFKATVLTVDPQSDVAVLKIDATKLPVVRLGDSAKVRVGEPVLTIGVPEGTGTTVTAGIVSATARTLPDGGAFPFFQTDIAVNPDNSGGPVFNRAGEVIGIAVQVYTGADRYASLTFAIPIGLAAKVRTQLQTQMQAQRNAPASASGNALGVDVQDVGAGLAAAFGLPRPAGALVNAVDPGSPAAAIGVKPGDVIVQLGDKPIGRSAELNDHAAALAPGAKAPLRLIRNRKPMTLTVTGGAAGAGTPAAGTDMAATQPAGGGDRLGLTMHPLTDDERRSTGLAVGMMVDDVRGPAAAAGIQPGDVVLALNDTLLETPDDIAMLEAKGGKVIAVLIQRNNARKFVSVRAR